MIVDLARDESAIWSGSVDSKRRNMIRKAMKSDVSVVHGKAIMDDFLRLYDDSARHNGLTPMGREFLSELAGGEEDLCFIPFVAYAGGRPVGALGLIHDKDYAIYWLGATDRHAAGLGQGEMLQWEAIRYSRVSGCRYYDLCYADSERLPGIFGFKKGFSDMTVPVPYLHRRPVLYRVLNKIKGR
jgi:lipid II:glycine glycyltransferase (peptidoglycan interpeptide bridge formation enzyme)